VKITKVEAFAVQAQPVANKAYWGSRMWGTKTPDCGGDISTEYPSPIRRRYLYSQTIDTVIVKVTTDDSLVGYGEAKAPVAPQVTKEIIDRLLADIVLGSDPRDVTVLWERMYAGMRPRGHRGGFYVEAISGVDIALWDVTAKAAQVPISKLLWGSFRDRVRVYASGLVALDDRAPEAEFAELGNEAKEIRRQGYTGVKVALGRGIPGDLKSIRTVRGAVGDEFIVYADACGVYDRSQALRLGKELEDLGVGWFEMPVFPEDLEGYEMLARELTIPIALDCLTALTRPANSYGGKHSISCNPMSVAPAALPSVEGSRNWPTHSEWRFLRMSALGPASILPQVLTWPAPCPTRSLASIGMVKTRSAMTF
jgi:D-galactarolactone cycloisomerase